MKFLTQIPIGYTELIGATTAPIGYKWYWNRQSLFHGEFKAVLVKQRIKVSL